MRLRNTSTSTLCSIAFRTSSGSRRTARAAALGWRLGSRCGLAVFALLTPALPVRVRGNGKFTGGFAGARPFNRLLILLGLCRKRGSAWDLVAAEVPSAIWRFNFSEALLSRGLFSWLGSALYLLLNVGLLRPPGAMPLGRRRASLRGHTTPSALTSLPSAL